MKYVLLYVLGYVVLFSVVWLHEVGHAIWHYRFGLRNNWWKVQVKPYIFFSTPGPVDADKLEKQQPIQHVLGAYGGIMMNAICAVISGIVLTLFKADKGYVSMALWLFMTLHIGEIVSYLFVGSIYLVSDMQLVNEWMPKLRLPNILVGAIIAILYIFLLISAPHEFRLYLVIWNVITVISMCVGRIIFTANANKKASSN